MVSLTPRLSVRAVIVENDRLLIVNAWKSRDHLWCAPGGGVEKNHSLPENLKREIQEETGVGIAVGPVCLINEFHVPPNGFHQVEIFFRCKIVSGTVTDEWTDPEGVVSKRRWVTLEEAKSVNIRPKSLAEVAWKDKAAPTFYDPLEPIVL